MACVEFYWGTPSSFTIYHILMSGETFFVSTGSITNQLLLFTSELKNGIEIPFFC